MCKNNRYLRDAPGEANNFLRRILRENRFAVGAPCICIYDPLSQRERLLAKGRYGTLEVPCLSGKTAWSGDRIIITQREMPIIDSGVTPNTLYMQINMDARSHAHVNVAKRREFL